MSRVRTVVNHIIILILSFVYGTLAFSNPEGGKVVTGNTTIVTTGNQTTINQKSDKTIIQWNSFNINKNEKTLFNQPQNGIALNRIDPRMGFSAIYGQLIATGKIILINPAGIYFGPGSYVNVAGIIATTANITNQNFLKNNLSFIGNNQGGFISNEGTIITQNNGLVALVASNVMNNGLIQANLGHIVLASGESFTISLDNTNLINFKIDTPASSPKGEKTGVSNKGTILADGGHVLIQAKTASNILNNSINMKGIIQANSVSEHHGEIILSADGGTVNVNGNLTSAGGKIKVLGQKVNLEDNAILNTSSSYNGGEILIGGDFQGKNPNILNADYTFIAKGASIYANALVNGQGGKVIIWSNKQTHFNGNIFAEGGALSGNGGFIEISAKDQLSFDGYVDANAIHGTKGSLLLDPSTIYIINGNSGDQDSSINSGVLPYSNPNTAANTISVGKLRSLGDINITLQATNQITVGSATGNSAQVDLSNTLFSGTLTLMAGDNNTVVGGNIIFNSGSSITTGGGGVNLIAGNINQRTGNALLGDISTNGGNISITAQQAINANGMLDAGSGYIVLLSNGLITVNRNITSLNNSISLKGEGITQAINSIINVNQGALTLDAGNQALTTSINSSLLSTGDLSLTANTMNLNGSQIGGDLFGTNANNVILTGQNGTSIGIAGGTGTLSLNNSVLNTVHAINVRIGSNQSGNIDVGNFTATNSFSDNGVFTLDSASNITQSGNLILTRNTTLILRDALNVNLNNINNSISRLAASIVGSLVIVNRSGIVLNIGSGTDDISPVNGINAPGGVNITTAGTTGTSLFITQNIITNNNDIHLTGFGINQSGSTQIDAGNGTIDINAGGTVLTSGLNSKILSTGNIQLTANNMLLNGNQIGGKSLGNTANNVSFIPYSINTTIGIAGGGGTLSLTSALLNTVHATNVVIGSNQSGMIRIGAWTPLSSFTNNGVITLITGNSILQNGLLDLSRNNASLMIRNANNVSLNNTGNVINNFVSNISGHLDIYSNHAINVTSLSDIYGTLNGISVNSGSISSANAININQAIFSTADLYLNANALNIASNTLINAGNMYLNASTGNLTLNNGSNLYSLGKITLTADHFIWDSNAHIGGSSLNTDYATTVILQGSTSGKTIAVASGLGDIIFNDSMLNTIYGTNLRIGNNLSGNIVVNHWTPANHVASNGVVTFDSAGTISQMGALDFSNNHAGLILRDASNVNFGTYDNIFNVLATHHLLGSISVKEEANHNLVLAALTDDIGLAEGINLLNNGSAQIFQNRGLGNIQVNSDISTANGRITINAGNQLSVSAGAHVGTLGGDINLGGANVLLNTDLVSNNGTIHLNGDVALVNDMVINAGTGSVYFINKVSSQGHTLTLQNNSNATGFVIFNDNVDLNQLVTFNQNYSIAFLGNNNVFSNNVTFNNTGSVTLGNSNADNFVFHNGLTHVAGSTSLNGHLASDLGDIHLAALQLGGDVTITADNHNIILGAINGFQNVTLDSGAGNITFNDNSSFNNLHIINTHDLLNNGIMNVNTYIQDAGNLTDFGQQGIVANADMNVTANNAEGNISTPTLTLNLQAANLFGTVNGLSDESAIDYIHNTNIIGPGTHYFNNIDMYRVVPTPVPPISPSNNNGISSNNLISDVSVIAKTQETIQSALPEVNQTNYNLIVNQSSNSIANVVLSSSTYPVSMNIAGILLNPSVFSRMYNVMNQPNYSLLATADKLLNGINNYNTTNNIFSSNAPNIGLLDLAKSKLNTFLENINLDLQNTLSYIVLFSTLSFLILIELRRRSNRIAIRNLSFDLRTSLNSISGFANLMFNETARQKMTMKKDFLRDILSSSKNLLKYVDNFNNNNMKFTTDLLKQLSFRLRTSLNSIKGFSELLVRDHNVSVSEKEYLEIIVANADQALDLVRV